MFPAKFPPQSDRGQRQLAWLAAGLVLLGLNVGFFAWTQGALAIPGMARAPVNGQAPEEIHPERLHISAPGSQAEVVVPNPIPVSATPVESEIMLEFEPAPQASAPSSAPVRLQAQPIVALKLRHPRR